MGIAIGNNSIEKGSLSFVAFLGKTTLKNVSCSTTTSCVGNLDAQNSIFQRVSTTGESFFEKSTIQDVVSQGNLHMKQCTAKTISSEGVVSSMEEEISHKGSTHIESSKIGSIVSKGKTRIDHSTVEHGINHTGPLHIIESKIKGPVEASSEKISIQNSQIPKIVVKDSSEIRWLLSKIPYFDFFYHVSPLKVSLELVGKHCKVDHILFEKGTEGLVVLKDGAKVEILEGNYKTVS